MTKVIVLTNYSRIFVETYSGDTTMIASLPDTAVNLPTYYPQPMYGSWHPWDEQSYLDRHNPKMWAKWFREFLFEIMPPRIVSLVLLEFLPRRPLHRCIVRRRSAASPRVEDEALEAGLRMITYCEERNSGQKIPYHVICGYREHGRWWFRIFGYGIHFHDHRVVTPLFSERIGRRKRFRIGAFCFGFLKPGGT